MKHALIMGNGQGTNNPKSARNSYATLISGRSNRTNPRSALRRFLESVDVNLTVWRENRPTDVDESVSERSIRYRVAKFRASAVVTFPKVQAQETWQVGWVQACHFIKFINHYGTMGYTSWEFPQLTRGSPCVNDSDGQNFPWYSYHKGMKEIKGPTKSETCFEVVMNDSPSSQLSLSVPSHYYQPRKTLTSVDRDQHFKVWLVVRNVNTDAVYPIKCISWNLTAAIEVSPENDQGSRVRVKDGPRTPPIIHKSAHPVPLQALLSPECNKAQALIWRPTDPRRKVSVIVPPSWKNAPPLTTRDLDNPCLEEEEKKRKSMIRKLLEEQRIEIQQQPPKTSSRSKTTTTLGSTITRPLNATPSWRSYK